LPDNFPSFPILDHVETKISSDTSKQFALIVKVPKDTPAGVYTSTVTFQASGMADRTMDINLEVLPYNLRDTNKTFWIYFADRITTGNFMRVSTDVYQKEVEDIKDHGFDSAFVYNADNFNDLKQQIQYAWNGGINKKLILGTYVPPIDGDIIDQGIIDYAKQVGYEDVYFYGPDEAWPDRLHSEYIPLAIKVKQAGGKMAQDSPKDAIDLLDDPDNAIYDGYPEGTYVPPELAAIYPFSPLSYFRDMIDGQPRSSIDSNRILTTNFWPDDLNPLTNRFNIGYYLWLNKFDGIDVFAYNFPYTYFPYKDFSAGDGKSNDSMVYVSQEGPVPTLEWEATRAGINDERYLETWQYYHDEVMTINPTLAQDSEDVVSQITDQMKDNMTLGASDDLSWQEQCNVRPLEYENYRNTIADETLKLYHAANPDITPPERSDGAPSGSLQSGTTQTNLTLTTDEAATCRYAISAGVAYADMANVFLTTGNIFHSTAVTGLTDGSTYHYYIRCADALNNPNTTDYEISFGVTASPEDQTDIRISNPSLAMGNKAEKLDSDETFYISSHTLRFQGNTSGLENGRVEIYSGNKKLGTNTISSGGKWSKRLKVRKNAVYSFSFRYFDVSENLVERSKSFKIRVDTESPRFTNLPKYLSKRPGENVYWKAKDNDEIKYFKYSFGGKVKKITASHFLLPMDISRGKHILRVKAFDRAGNVESRKVVINIR
jgi:hypothetical protein